MKVTACPGRQSAPRPRYETTIPSAAASAANAATSRSRRASSQPVSARHRRGDAAGRGRPVGAHGARRGQPEPRAAQQHVADGPRLLAPGRVDGLRQQVDPPGDHRLGQLGPLDSDPQHLVRRVAVAARELLVGLLRHAGDLRQVAGVDGHAERDLVRAAGGVAALALHDPVDGHLRHPPPGRQLAARDRHHPAGGLVELGLAGDVDGLLRVAGRDQRPHARVGARDVARAQVGGEELVGGGEQVLDVVERGLHVLQVALVVVVGGADQRLPEPREHEDRAPAPGGRDRARHERQRGAVDDDVRAAARPDDGHLGLVVELLGAQPVGPHAGRVDDVGGAHLQLGPALGVAHARADGPAALLEQPGRLDAVDGDRAEALGLGEHGQHEPGVVGLAVVEQVAAARLAGGESRQQLRDLLAGDHAVPRGAPVLDPVAVAIAPAPERRDPVERHHVVHVQPDADQAVGPGAVEGGDDQRQRADEVRRQRGVDLALEQRLAHQPEVEVLQVAQAAVHELARPRRGPDRVVPALDQRDRVPARGGVERDAGARDPAADHEHVERLAVQRPDRVRPGEHQMIGTAAGAAPRSWIVDAGRCRPKGNSGSATGAFGRCRSGAARQHRGVVVVAVPVI